MPKCLTDNMRPTRLSELALEQSVDDLRRIANKPIEKLVANDNVTLLAFPQSFKLGLDDIDENCILNLYGDELSTGNIMGFVGVNDTMLTIKSRFAKNEEEDYFLHYMLMRVFHFNLTNLKHSVSSESVFDLLLFVFPFFLKKAFRQGVYKKYRRYEYNDSNIRGPIDVSRHIRENVPFRGTVAYSTRIHSYDNEVTELIRHTIEFIKCRPLGRIVLGSDAETKSAVSALVQATPSYNVKDRNRIVNQNLRPVSHPYYSEYTELQQICVRILRYESIKFGQGKNQVYGVLFDGAWLWEEYLDKILSFSNLGITHAKNKEGINGVPLYEGGRNYFPDFYHKTGVAENSFVLDAKYKRLGFDLTVDGQDCNKTNTISICRDDLFQMITYMHVLPARHCALLYPIERNDDNSNGIILSASRKLHGDGGEIIGIGIPIVESASFVDFCDKQKNMESELVEEVKNWLGKSSD